MITYHQIKQITRKMAQQAVYVGQLQETLAQVNRLSDLISGLGQELKRDQEKMSHEIRSVEVLDEILKKHVYGKGSTVGGSGMTGIVGDDGDGPAVPGIHKTDGDFDSKITNLMEPRSFETLDANGLTGGTHMDMKSGEMNGAARYS